MRDALTETRSLSAEFGETLANHAAMLLQAQARLGDRAAEGAYRAFFRAELVRPGSAEALQRAYLPALLRLAYANDADYAGEVAESLGYWAATFLPLGAGIGAAACISNDEHDISLVYSARCEQAIWGDPLYRVVAARRMGLLGN